MTPAGLLAAPSMSPERARVWLVAGSIAAILVTVPVLLAASITDWPLAFVIAGVGSGSVLVFAVRRRDALLLHLWLFGLVFGVAELAVDAWLVHRGVLDYSPYSGRGGPMGWASPLFMPVSWQVLAIHLAVLVDALRERPLGLRLFAATLAGALYVPVGEELSIRAGFWTYRGVPGISNVPWFIVVGEAVLAAAIVLLLPLLRRREPRWTFLAGAAACAALGVGYAAAL